MDDVRFSSLVYMQIQGNLALSTPLTEFHRTDKFVATMIPNHDVSLGKGPSLI